MVPVFPCISWYCNIFPCISMYFHVMFCCAQRAKRTTFLAPLGGRPPKSSRALKDRPHRWRWQRSLGWRIWNPAPAALPEGLGDRGNPTVARAKYESKVLEKNRSANLKLASELHSFLIFLKPISQIILNMFSLAFLWCGVLSILASFSFPGLCAVGSAVLSGSAKMSQDEPRWAKTLYWVLSAGGFGTANLGLLAPHFACHVSRQAKVEDKRPSIERFRGKLDDVVSNPKVKHLNSGASFVNCQCATGPWIVKVLQRRSPELLRAQRKQYQ